jgi:hypothetical protein
MSTDNGAILEAPALASTTSNLTAKLGLEIIGQNQTDGQINQADIVITPAEEYLWLQERDIWQQHVFWTRMAIIAISQNSDDQGPVVNRLLRNYKDMADAVNPYYGRETAKEYGDRIRDHLLIAAALVSAVRDDNKTAIEIENTRWYKNAEDIAKLESNITNLSLQDRKTMWFEHLNFTKNETLQLHNKDYNASIDTFDRIQEQGNMMADSLTQGTISQFPKAFH